MCLGQTTIAIVRVAASYKALELGASALGVGIVGGAFAALSLVAAVPLGVGIDRYGQRRFLIAGTLLLLAAPVVEFTAGAIWLLIVGQALLGLGQTAQAVAVQTRTANDSDSRLSADERFTRMSVAAGSGQLVGPVLAGIAVGVGGTDGGAGAGTSMAFLLACVAALGALGSGLLARSTGHPPDRQRSGERRSRTLGILRRREFRTALVASIAVLTTLDIMLAYLPLLGEERGIPPQFIGLLLSLQAAAGLTFRVVLPRLLRSLGRRTALAVLLAVSGASMLGIAFASSRWQLVPLVILLGVGLGAGQPLTMSWTAESADVSERGAALAVRVAANRLGQLLVPSMIGALAVSLGSAAVFVSGAAGLILGSVWLRRRARPGTG
jgi:MFS family permease